MFRASPRPSSGAHNSINSLWFYRWSVVVAALLVVVWPAYLNCMMMHGPVNVKRLECWSIIKIITYNLQAIYTDIAVILLIAMGG
jgi:fumarate reductase subunit D